MTADAPGSAPAVISDTEIRRIVIGLMLVLFLAAIDQTLISVALLSIGQSLGRIDLMPWVISGYLVASTIATPIYGKLSDLYGRWPILATALGLYVVASLLCAIAQTMPQLIVFRILHGMGGGALIALVQATVGDVAPGPQRGRYQAYIASVFATASVAGPLLGGLITEHLSWRAAFLINLPMGAAAFLIARRALRRLPRGGRARSIDYLGALLLTGGLSALMIAITRLGQGVHWSAPSTLWLLAAALVLLALTALQEHRAIDPLLPPALFHNRVVVSCFAILGALFFALLGLSVLLPLWIQAGTNIGLDEVALRILPFTLAPPLTSTIGGRLMMRGASLRTLIIAGCAIVALGAALLALATPSAVVWFTVFSALAGAGIGFAMPTGLVTVQAAVDRSQVGIATATAALFRTLGGAIGVALLTAIVFAMVGTGGATGGGAAALRDAMGQGASTAQFDPAFRVAFLVVAAINVGALLIALRMPDPRHGV